MHFYPKDTTRFSCFLIIKLRFLDDILHKWSEYLQFYDLINSLNEDLRYILENPIRTLNPSETLNFLDIHVKVVDSTSVFDI